jgi:hypothetical protein
MIRGHQDNSIKKEAIRATFIMLMTVSFLSSFLVAPQALAVTHYNDILASSSAHILSGTGSFSDLV